VRRGKLALLVIPFAALVLGGCATSSTGAQATGPQATGAPNPTAPWMLTNGGPVASVPAPAVSFSSPAPFPTGFLPISTVSPPVTPAPSGNDCASVKFHAGEINSAGVVAGTTSANVSWYNPGGADLVEYRVTAIAQHQLSVGNQRDIGWTVVKPGSGCGMMSAPVTGLDPGTSYVFSVDAVFTKLGEDGTWASTVARSIPTTTR
jgi:hypothetical protein